MAGTFPKRPRLGSGSASTIARGCSRGTASRKASGIAFMWDIVSTPIPPGRIVSATCCSQSRRRVLILQGLASTPRHLCTTPEFRAGRHGPPPRTIQLRHITELPLGARTKAPSGARPGGLLLRRWAKLSLAGQRRRPLVEVRLAQSRQRQSDGQPGLAVLGELKIFLDLLQIVGVG
jgi:hypothetical protein